MANDHDFVASISELSILRCSKANAKLLQCLSRFCLHMFFNELGNIFI